MLTLLAWLTPLCSAQDAATQTTAPAAPMMEVNLRYRSLSVPNTIMDAWFYNEEDGAPFPRPSIGATGVGGELVLRPRPANWVFYAEYLISRVEEGYWDDVDDTPDHDDGDWVRPENMGAFVVGANLMHEQRVTPDGADVGFAVLMGGGLGLTFVTGNLVTWKDGTNPDNTDPDCMPTSDAWDRVDVCPADEDKRVPRLLPMLDFTLSAKVDYQDTYHLRLDAGLHTMLYFGLAGGAAF